MVDKIIALGLIDVRDVEEVGETPLQNDVGMSEELAEQVVDRCIEEAKLVIKEVEIEKAAKEAAKHQAPDLLAALGSRSASASEPAPVADEPTVAASSDGSAVADAPAADEPAPVDEENVAVPTEEASSEAQPAEPQQQNV
jgi:hypothetical protein